MTLQERRPLRVRGVVRCGTLIAILAAVGGCDANASKVGEVVALWARSALYEPFRSPSEAMAPTLGIGDHFFVDKSVYSTREPARGEVVVFHVARSGSEIFPADLQPDLAREVFVKRIVGVPGDIVESRDGRLLVNGSPAVEVETTEVHRSKAGPEARVYEVDLAGARFRIARDDATPELPVERIEVPADRYFVMGDYRNRSNDSRVWGTVHRADLIGPVTYIYYSGDDRRPGPAWRHVSEEPRY